MWFIDWAHSIHLVFLGTGLAVGFGHCLGMCGPIVLSLSMRPQSGPVFFQHLYYHGGRILTYGILGAVMGGTASFTRFAAGIGGFQKWLLIGAGILIAWMGLGMTGWIRADRFLPVVSLASGRIGSWYRRWMNDPRPLAFLPMGMVLGLLPCGPVYTAMIAAAGVGTTAKTAIGGIIGGCGVMICFGLGTMPALLLLSRLSSIKWLKSRETIYRAAGIVMIGMGISFTWKGIVF